MLKRFVTKMVLVCVNKGNPITVCEFRARTHFGVTPPHIPPPCLSEGHACGTFYPSLSQKSAQREMDVCPKLHTISMSPGSIDLKSIHRSVMVNDDHPSDLFPPGC